MTTYRIRGGNALSGELRVCGGKNAVLPILSAVILNGSESVIHNCPRIHDTKVSIKILESVGCTVKMDGNTMVVDSSGASNWKIPQALVSEMRSSITFMGGLIGRFGRANISYPGGCDTARRIFDCASSKSSFEIIASWWFGIIIQSPGGLFTVFLCLKLSLSRIP